VPFVYGQFPIQIIFGPIPRVDGIDPSADPLLELRAAIYLLSGRRRRAAM
jgi:catalase